MKAWYSSKMVWANIITFLIAVLALVSQVSFLTPKIVEVVLLASAVLNVVLRIWFTNLPIEQPVSFGG